MKKLWAQEIVFFEKEVVNVFRKIDRQAELEIDRIIYYPYYFFEFEVNAKSLLKFKWKVGCTVDALGGMGAIVDVEPHFFEQEIKQDNLPVILVEKEAASKKVEQYVFDSASSKAKFITIPKIKKVSSQLFYRPFWVANYKRSGKEMQQFIVDAVSGGYHPL